MRRGRGLRQWQRTPQAPRERQVGAAKKRIKGTGDGDRAIEGISSLRYRSGDQFVQAG